MGASSGIFFSAMVGMEWCRVFLLLLVAGLSVAETSQGYTFQVQRLNNQQPLIDSYVTPASMVGVLFLLIFFGQANESFGVHLCVQLQCRVCGYPRKFW